MDAVFRYRIFSVCVFLINQIPRIKIRPEYRIEWTFIFKCNYGEEAKIPFCFFSPKRYESLMDLGYCQPGEEPFHLIIQALFSPFSTEAFLSLSFFRLWPLRDSLNLFQDSPPLQLGSLNKSPCPSSSFQPCSHPLVPQYFYLDRMFS